MNKLLVFLGIAIVIVSKVIVLKSILIDSPAYMRCVSDTPTGLVQSCGSDPFSFFIAGWFITIAGFILLIFGLRLPATKSISR
jgi:uncharacterized membrane protein